MRMRLVVVLATLAALLGAPSLASAAGNSLSDPSVSPTSGSATTVFTLRVSYSGRPALAVTVTVAGLPLPMARVSGSAEDGVWSVSTLLPEGTWTPTFSTVTQRGNAPRLTGPTISVGESNATPDPTGSGPTPRDNGIDSGDPSVPADPVEPGDPVDPGAAPVESAIDDDGPGSPDPVASSTAGPSSRPDGGGGASAPSSPSAPAGQSGEGATGGQDDAGGADGPDTAPADAPEAETSDDPEEMPLMGDEPADDPATVSDEQSLMMVGVAAVTIAGVACLIAVARRRATGAAASTPPTVADTEALLERRTLRQAKVRLTDDPIVAAMGVEDQVAARRLRRRPAGQVSDGPGERPPRRR